MNETDFRFKHSELIMYYQLIEFRLKILCSDLLSSDSMEWFSRLEDYDNDPFGKLLVKISETQQKTGKTVLKDSEIEELKEIKKSRNYWVHKCFTDSKCVTFSQDRNSNQRVLRNNEYAIRLNMDLDQAKDWNEKLTEKHIRLAKKSR